jgi:hypothetical protein
MHTFVLYMKFAFCFGILLLLRLESLDVRFTMFPDQLSPAFLFLSVCLVNSKVLNSCFCSRVYVVPGIKRIAANMSSTSSQRGYPARRGSAANMSSTSSQRGYPARKSEPWTRLTHQERRPQWVAYNPRTMRPPPLSTDTSSMKILSWNVNGLQTMVQSGFSADELVGRENFDVLCLQETHLEVSCFGVSITTPSCVQLHPGQWVALI